MNFPRISQSETSTLFLALVNLCLLLLPTTVRASCKDHISQYCSDITCMQMFITKQFDMHLLCKDLRQGFTDECSPECQNAITDFMTSYNESEGFFKCNCSDTPIYDYDTCELDRKRLRVCPPIVDLFPPKIEDQTPTCIASSQECESDPGCKARLDAYLETCNPEQTDPQSECSLECMGTLEAVYSEPLASNFWECNCVNEVPHKWCRTSPSEYYELCEGHNMFTTSSPEVPYKPLTTKPTLPSATKVGSSSDTKQQTGNSNKEKPGNAAPSINMNLIYQAALLTLSLLVGML